jgi:hypothetical protein
LDDVLNCGSEMQVGTLANTLELKVDVEMKANLEAQSAEVSKAELKHIGRVVTIADADRTALLSIAEVEDSSTSCEWIGRVEREVVEPNGRSLRLRNVSEARIEWLQGNLE